MAFLSDGWQTFITMANFAGGPGVLFREKEVTPPGVDGGGPIDTTTMRNNVWRTLQPKHLKTLTEMKLQVQYDTRIYPVIVSIVNVVTTVGVDFPDGEILNFLGWLQDFKPLGLKEGDFALADITIHPANQTGLGVVAGVNPFSIGEVGPTLNPGTF